MNIDYPSSFLNDVLPRLEHREILMLGIGDVLIHSPGFEDRTMAFAEAILFSANAKAIYCYRPFNPKNRLADVRQTLLSRGIDVRDEDIIEYNRFEPGNFEDRLKNRS